MDKITALKIAELKEEYSVEDQRSMRRQYLLSYYRKAFEKQYKRSKKYITDTVIKTWYFMDMQEKAVRRSQFDTAFILADKVKECIAVLKKYQDAAYFKKLAGQEQKPDPKTGKPLKWIVTDAAIRRAKEYPITQLHEFDRHNKCLCPFHNDKDPSMQYYPSTNSVHCFSEVKSWDSIQFYMEKFSTSFADAVRALQ